MIDVSWAGKIPSHWDVVPLKSKAMSQQTVDK